MNSLFTKEPPQGTHTDLSMGVRVEPATILTVNAQQGWADCLPDGDTRVVPRVPLPHPYQHPDGSGLFILPQRGARVLLLYPDRGIARILAYRSEWVDRLGFAGVRRALAEGDIALQTAQGAHLLVSNNGRIEAVAAPGLRLALSPVANRLRVRAENLDLGLVGGRWLWRHDRETAQVVLEQTATDYADQAPKLTMTQGYHDDGALWRLYYQDPTVVPTPREVRRQAVLSVGALGEGRRVELDVDDGMYTRSIGQTDRGVVRTRVTDHSPAKRPTWSFEQVIGPDGSVLLRQVLSTAQGPVLALTVEDDGTVQVAINRSRTTLTIDAEGLVRLETDAVHVASDRIRLGSDDADEPVVLGDAWKTYFDGFIRALLLHKHISNLGGPTGPVIDVIESMSRDQLSDTVFSKK